MEYSMEYLKKRIEEHPEEIKNMIRTQLNKCEDSIDPTGYLDYLELASIALSKDGLLLEQIESEIANKDYVRLAGIAIINNPKVYSKVKKSKIDLVLDDGGVEIDPFSSFDLGEIGEDNSKEIPYFDELEYYVKVAKDPRYIEYLPTELHHYMDILFAEAEAFPFALFFVPRNIEGYKEIALALVQKRGSFLRYINSFYTEGYKEIAIAAVKQDFEVLKDISVLVEGYKEIVLAAVQQNVEALKYVRKDFIDKEIADLAFSKDMLSILYIPTSIEGYIKMAVKAVKHHHFLAKTLSEIMDDSKEFEIRVVEAIINYYYQYIYLTSRIPQSCDDYVLNELVNEYKYSELKAKEMLNNYHEYLENNHEKTM